MLKKLEYVVVHVVADFVVQHCGPELSMVDFVPWTLFFDGSSCLQRVPASAMNPIIKSWPFRGWRIDLIGQIYPPSSKNHKFILVATDYFTKWVEAIPLKNVISKEMIEFVKEHIIYQFGIPQTITTDQGTIFISDEFEEFATGMGIKLLNSFLYYA